MSKSAKIDCENNEPTRAALDKLTVSDIKNFNYTKDLDNANVVDRYIEAKTFSEVGNSKKCLEFLHKNLNDAMVLNFMDKFQKYPSIDFSEIKCMIKKYSQIETINDRKIKRF